MIPQNLFRDIPPDSGAEIFELLASNEHVRIERIISRGQKRSPAEGWYDQQQNEWVLVLKGHAKIEFEDGSVTDLIEGDYLDIKAHIKHRVLQSSTTTETLWLAIHY